MECCTQTQTAALAESATQTDCGHDVQVTKWQETIISHSSNTLINRSSNRKSKILILGASNNEAFHLTIRAQSISVCNCSVTYNCPY